MKRDGKMSTSDNDNWGMVRRVIETVISDVWYWTRLYLLSLMFARVHKLSQLLFERVEFMEVHRCF
jgi:hypothetical protein